ncbi:MAG: hypothetical protein DHS20C01_04510 [marine bacterium B5-7]|nr:MAG: hypothetical protein DHS20C01_04510 [marine bacterium B5-7]
MYSSKRTRCLRGAVFSVIFTSLTPLHANDNTDSNKFVVKSGGASLNVFTHERPEGIDPAPFIYWVQHAADVVSDYYDGFPVNEAQVDLDFFNGGGTVGGSAYGDNGARVAVTVGSYSETGDLKHDWRLVHEMVHLALPQLPQKHHWLVEGLATYLESITRARAGDLDEAYIWRGFTKGMPNGLPLASEQGLDTSRRWGSTYWGGALFCLVADVRIREATDNTKSLRDAVIGIHHAGLDHRQHTSLSPLIEIADRATGTTVLHDLYLAAGSSRWNLDLDGLWRDLGVSSDGTDIVFDDSAPLTHIRRSITRVE